MKKVIIFLSAVLSCLCLSCRKDEGLQESQFIYFSITAPYTRIGGIDCKVDNINMTVTNIDPIPSDIDLTDVAPYFVLNHEGMGVFVKGVQQTSGVSRINLESPVDYEVVSARGTLTYRVTLTKSDKLHTQAGVILSKYTDLVGSITSDREKWLDPGLRFSEVDFLAKDGRALRMDIFEVDLECGSVDLYPLTADNNSGDYSKGATWPIQTIPLQAAAAESAGVKVLGAVNGDVFAAGSTNAPDGPICRNGKMLKELFRDETNTHYFAVRNDRRAAVGDYSSFLSLQSNFSFAIGANKYLLEGNAPAAAIKNDRTRNHHVGIGINALDHKSLYIICVEGAMGAASALSLLELAYILKQFGAAEAINMDGGDSATFVVKEDGAFKVMNRPDGPLWKVVNGIAIIKK